MPTLHPALRVAAHLLAFILGTLAWACAAYYGLLAWVGGTDYMAPFAALLFIWPISVPLLLLSPVGGLVGVAIASLVLRAPGQAAGAAGGTDATCP